MGKEKKQKPIDLDDPVTDIQLCRLFNRFIPDIFNKIYLPYNVFKHYKFDIEKALQNNTDSLFYAEGYAIEEDEKMFNKVFDKYLNLVYDVFDNEGALVPFLRNLNDNNIKPEKSRIIKIINKYDSISPALIAEKYTALMRKFSDRSKEDIVKILDHQLESINEKARTIIVEFNEKFHELLNEFVYENNMNDIDPLTGKLLISTVMGEIWESSNKLIDLGIYAIHEIFHDIIGIYIPIDEIVHYNPESEDNRSLIIV